MKWQKFLSALAMVTIVSSGLSGDEAGIPDKRQKYIQKAVKQHIAKNTFKGRYEIRDVVRGEKIRLELKGLHDEIERKGQYYVSCANFVDVEGREYDVDLLVVRKGGKFRVTLALIHRIDGQERKYTVEGNK